ncbi:MULTISPECIES: DVU0298 family protein [unclassified Pseudodesulfovibrio]|uniref:DVU0298 family protein n=1 Tax=unclassified Pseudodesulfovibrio TaxID=2661612 RepID=UPI000FEB73EF|nr:MULTISPECIES: DVU0298 family protein [unclassified Pseudodesulfovibrio]MCJ2166227.1 HEAT repeat domain-containing protein [Pseudodesulfovibrio sp. S3-i]RWU02315.1 HEAT repeat domain-containing protein [Pseudodesulfovibrio sp. S3]
MSRFRSAKKKIREILAGSDWQARLSELDEYRPGDIVPPLLNLRLDKDEAVRWRSATAFGLTVGRMAEASMEKARVVMRTLMWHMNEESGNLGWGIPHFMAEAMVNNRKVAKEFHKILVSYIFCDAECDGNFLDHPELRRDVYWGLARLAGVRPELVAHGERFLMVGLDDPDAHNRAYAAWVLGEIKAAGARDKLETLKDDGAEIRTFRNGEIVDTTVGRMVCEALEGVG